MASEHKAPRSLAVESVREGRVARQPEAKDMKMVFEAFTPFWPAMDGNASGLVNDQHHRVAVKEAGGQFVLRHGLETHVQAYHQPRHLNQTTGMIALSAMTASPNS